MTGDSGEAQKPKEGVVDKAFGEAAKNFGKEIAPVGTEAGKVAARAANALLKTAGGAIWGYEKIQDWIEREVEKKLEGVSPKELTEPDLRIAGPTIEAMRFAGKDDKIQELFAQLIASDMQKTLKEQVHPSFVEIIKQLDSADAAVFTILSKLPEQIRVSLRVFIDPQKPTLFLTVRRTYTFEVPMMQNENIDRSINSLQRLGLIEIGDWYPVNPRIDAAIEKVDKNFFEPIRLSFRDRKSELHKEGIQKTPLGRAFASCCIPKK